MHIRNKLGTLNHNNNNSGVLILNSPLWRYNKVKVIKLRRKQTTTGIMLKLR